MPVQDMCTGCNLYPLGDKRDDVLDRVAHWGEHFNTMIRIVYSPQVATFSLYVGGSHVVTGTRKDIMRYLSAEEELK